MRFGWAGILVLGLVGLAACGLDPHAGDDPNTAYVYLNTEIRGLDPVFAQDAISGECCLQVYDALYEYEYLARPYELKPCLAAALPEVSEDGLIHTIALKQGVFFHDDPCFEGGKGREVTAADAVFCLKRLMDARLVSPGSWILEGYVKGLDDFRAASETQDKHRTVYEDVEGLEVLDRYRLRITLTKPYPQLHYVLAMVYASVYPPEAIGHYQDEFLNHPVGTGPFVPEFFRRTQRLALSRNPTYRKDTYPTRGTEEDRRLGRLDDAGKPIPFVDRLVLTVYKESQPLWLDFLLGYLDRGAIPKDQFGGAVDASTGELRPELARRDIQLEKTPEIEIIYDAFNMLDPVLGLPNGDKGRAIRRAMSLANDEEWARTKLYNDRVQSMPGLLVPEFQSFDPDFVNPWKRKEGESYEEALERAKQILADAGYPNGEGIPVLTIEVNDNVVSGQHYAAFKRDMERIGIRLRANRVTFQQMLDRVDKAQAQIWGAAWLADYPDAQNFFQLFYGPNKSPGPNGSNYQSPEFDRLFAVASAMPPGPERAEIYRRLQQIVVEDCVWIFKYRRVTYSLTQPWLFNYKRNSISSKYGKYLRVDPAMRQVAVAKLNRPNLTPVWVFFGVVVFVVIVTIWGARRRVRAW